MDLKPSNNRGGSQSPLEFNKKAIIAASVIVGVLLLVGVSYGVYYKVSGTSKKVQTTNTPNTVNTNTSNLPVNATDWKTFSDKGLGFEIKYPSNWSYTNEGGIVNFKETGKQYLIEGSESVPVSVSVLDSVGNDTSLDRANKRNRYNGSVKSLTVAGQNAAEVKDYLGIETYIVYSGSVYVVATPNFGEEKTDTSIHNVYSEMLKTLKFLDKSSNVSDWQTYKNAKYGYEFKYPADWKILEGESADNPTMISIRKASTQKAIDEAKSAGNLYGPMLDDIVVYYYNSIADEPSNKTGKLGATTVDELIQKNTLITKVGTEQVGNTQGTGVMWAGHLTDYVVLVTSNSHLYEISFTSRGSKDEVSSEERQILSTFKFTNSEDFSVKELGIKFKVAKELKDDLIYSYSQKIDTVTGKLYKVALFSTKTLKSKDKNCAAESAPLGAFSKYEGKKADYDNPYLENRDSEIRQLDTFFVHYAGPQALCSEDKQPQTNQLKLFNQNLPGGIEEIK